MFLFFTSAHCFEICVTVGHKGLPSLRACVERLYFVTPLSRLTVQHAEVVLGKMSHSLTEIDFSKQEDTRRPWQCSAILFSPSIQSFIVSLQNTCVSGETCGRCCELLFLPWMRLPSVGRCATASPPAAHGSSVSLAREKSTSAVNRSCGDVISVIRLFPNHCLITLQPDETPSGKG